MNLLAIASRADLGYSISSSLQQAHLQLDAAGDFLRLVEGSLDLTKDQSSYHLSSSLMGALGFFEASLSDIGKKFLIAYPGRLDTKTINLSELSSAGSIMEVLKDKASKHINDLAYGRFRAYSNAMVELFSSGKNISEETVSTIAEIKAARDLYAHAGGRVNATYLEKAGTKARARSTGNILELTPKYVADAFAQLKAYLDEFKDLISSQVLAHGRTATLRQMWEATVLSRRMAFENAWVIEDENMVRPNDEAQDAFGWSHSELMLLDFFLGIYSSEYPRRRYDLITSLERWPASSNERKVMQSWVEMPFWF